ncbi:MAG TPA: Clp protease N-terminal domain-containing protein [Gaiellaceae bacterium]|jgi:plasmid stability protein/ATP-dependent Clp protease ATP-binding subunit ClpA
MATLHVRNIPDDLYELLRERAAENDRSIGAETVQLLQEHLPATNTARRLGRLRRRPGGEGPFLNRFTPMARAAIRAAQEEARGLGHDHIGTEHLLLGVLAEAPGVVDVSPESVRAQLEPGSAQPTGRIPFTPDAKKALELALRAALTHGHAAIEPRHLLVGISGTASRGCELLHGAKIDVPLLEATPEPAFRVVPLEGDAASWEKQLNEAASLGYELVEIVDRRAILRR